MNSKLQALPRKSLHHIEDTELETDKLQLVHILFLTLIWILLFEKPAFARAPYSQICDQVSQLASDEIGVPISVLKAITRTETGREQNGVITPWPWAVNMEGKGNWFDSLDEARAYVFKNFKRGARSFDVGCFQLNYKWHHQEFSSIDEMFDPVANARYAARFLKKLYSETGNWSDAAGTYHSRTPKHATKYKAIFESHLTQLPGRQSPKQPLASVAKHQAKVNSYPLLQNGAQTAQLGSLVPLKRTGPFDGFLTFNKPSGG